MSIDQSDIDDILDGIDNLDESASDRSVMNPITGVMVDMDDIDAVIKACDECKTLAADLKTFDDMLRRRAVEFTTGDAKTRRIQGQTLRAKIEMPDETWDQPVLKSLWADERHKEYRDRYLGLGSVNVKKAEFKKLKGLTASDPLFQSFMGALLAAEKPPTGAPRVTLEK